MKAMRSRLLVAAILSAAFVGGGVLSAQPGATPSGGSPSTPTAGTPSAGAPAPTPAPAPAPTPAPTPPAPEPDLALPSEKTSNLSAQEMDQKSDELIENMEGLHRRDGQTVVYRLRAGLKAPELARAREALGGRGKFTWLSEHWKEYFDVVPVKAGLATLERVEILAGLSLRLRDDPRAPCIAASQEHPLSPSAAPP